MVWCDVMCGVVFALCRCMVIGGDVMSSPICFV
jgi:hypothetical protein